MWPEVINAVYFKLTVIPNLAPPPRTTLAFRRVQIVHSILTRDDDENICDIGDYNDHVGCIRFDSFCSIKAVHKTRLRSPLCNPRLSVVRQIEAARMQSKCGGLPGLLPGKH
jgi:hypothetical protein